MINKEKKSFLQKAFGIRTEEIRPVILMLLFSFFMGLSLTFYFTASNAIFIRHFESGMIPVSFILSGILVYIFWRILSAIDKRLNPAMQIVFKFVFVLITVVVISIGIWFQDTPWLVFIMYTFVRVMVYITMVTFWGLAGKIFNLRQGKRIFGLIGAGEVISIIIGNFSIPLLLKITTTPSLLFLSSAALFICFILVLLIIKIFKAQLNSKAESSSSNKNISRQWKYSKLVRQPYFFLISMMALLPIFAYLFIDFMFLDQVKITFNNDQETIAKFFGYILGFVAVVELLFKLFVSGRLLNRYGLLPSLLALPVLLFFGTFLASLVGTVNSEAMLFFAFIVFSRLLDRSVRGAIYEPAFQLLYQPVPGDQRISFQSQIEGIPKAAGTVVSGLIILLFSSLGFLKLVHYNYIFLIILALWISIGMKMYRSYRNKIRESIEPEDKSKDHQKQTVEDSCITTLRKAVKEGSISNEKAYYFLKRIHPALIEEFFSTGLKQGDEDKVRDIIKLSGVHLMTELRKDIEMLAKTASISVSKEYEYCMHEFEMAEKSKLSLIEGLAASKNTDDQYLAVKLCAANRSYKTQRLLLQLMKSSHSHIAREAIIAASRINKIELNEAMLDLFTERSLRQQVFSIISRKGFPSASSFNQLYNKLKDDTEGKIRLIELAGNLNKAKRIILLKDKIRQAGKQEREAIFKSLSNEGYTAGSREIPIIRQSLEDVVAYMAWVLASIQDIAAEKLYFKLRNTLEEEFHLQKEKIFIYLSLLYDKQAIQQIRRHIESGNSQSRIFAMEISDMLVSQDIKDLFVPVFDEISVDERLQLLKERFPQYALSPRERLLDIVNADYSWVNPLIKSYALELMLGINEKAYLRALAANMLCPERIIRETAAWVLAHTDNHYFIDNIVKQKEKYRKQLQDVVAKSQRRKGAKALLMSEKSEYLKNHPSFSCLPLNYILRLTELSTEYQGKDLKKAFKNNDSLIIIMSGQLMVKKTKTLLLKAGEIYLTGFGQDNHAYDTEGKEDSLAIAIPMWQIYEYMHDSETFMLNMLNGLKNNLQ